MTNPNDMPKASIAPEDLNALFDRTNEQALADREARLRAAQWPNDVEDALTTLSHGLVALRARIDAMEARLGSLPG